MDIQLWLEGAYSQLSELPSAHLDAQVLLGDCLGKDRGWLLAHPEFKLSASQLNTLEAKLARRSLHEPLAYIRGKSEFYGRDFTITHATLQPRPETETMIEHFKQLPIGNQAVVLDMGTGSGAIIITAKLERPDIIAYAVDVQSDALGIAKKNATKHQVDITFFKGSLFEPLAKKNVDIILANLPYVPDEHTINEAAMQEPKIAIFGGPDGLDLYRRLFDQITNRSQKPEFILTESLPFQHEKLRKIAALGGYLEINEDDFIQVFGPA